MSMLASSGTDSFTARFEPYIEELRDFFASRHLPSGVPDSLPLLLDHLHDPAFNEEMVSMVRSIHYREESMPRVELMEVIAVAAGGQTVLDDRPELREPLRQILAFVQEVTRAKPGFTLQETTADDADLAGDAFPAEATAPAGDLDSADAAASHREATEPDPSHFTLVNDQLSRTLLQLHPSPTETVEPRDADPQEPLRPVLAQPISQPTRQTRSTLAAVLRHSYWIPGVVVLFLVIIAGALLRRQPSTPGAVAAPRGAALLPALRGLQGAARGAVHRAGRAPQLPSSRVAGVNAPRISALPLGSESATPTRPRAAAGTAAPPGNRLRGNGHSRSAHPLSAVPPSAREGVFLSSSGNMASHLLSAPAPGYPRLASLTRTQGQVVVQVVVGRDGRVMATRVLDGPHLLRNAAEHAIHQWRYRPFLVEGHPTDVATIVTVSFRLP